MGKIKRAFNLALEAIAKQGDFPSVAKAAKVDVKEVERSYKVLRRHGYLAFTAPPISISIAALASKSKLTVVQVGANDGRSGDPIFKLVQQHSKKIMLIEPIPELIPALEKNYGAFGGETIIENVAVGLDHSDFALYRLHPAHWDDYVARVGRHPTEISSFELGPIQSKISQRMNLSSDEAAAIIERFVCPSAPLSSLIDKHGLDEVDLLQVDCEGFDVDAIKSLGSHRPHIINFESFNLTAAKWAEWKAWAADNGYGYVQGRNDTLAIRGASFALEF